VSAGTPAAPAAERVLLITRMLDAPRDLVFQAWSSPEHLARWWGPKDFHLPACEVDFRPGGRYRLCMRAPDGEDHWVWGTYQEINPPERLVFTWDRVDPEGSPRSSTVVTITLTEQGDRTRLSLHQTLFETTADRDEHEGGWGECLDRLTAFAKHLHAQDATAP
jgi:uncharacterized protein YndB with AHSA1/START domain